jgi:diguanylate cyclase (GGDEF)-like protein
LFGLQFRTTLLLTCVVLAATGLTGVLYLRISTQFALEESKHHARHMAGALASAAADAVERRERQSLLSLAEDIVRTADMPYVMFTDQTGDVLACARRGTGNLAPLVLGNGRAGAAEPGSGPQLVEEDGQRPRIDVVYPITKMINLGTDHESSETIGYVHLGLGLMATEARMHEVVRSMIGLAVGITLLMVPLGYEVVRHLARPINRLSEAVRTFAAGDHEMRVPVSRRDEIGDLGRAFNFMADELTSSHLQLVELNAELEQRVLERTTALADANERLQDMAVRDSLTGLYNRRHFSELLERLFAEALRYGTDITCMMLDLDDFKRVNDSLGHPMGDQLLQLAARVIRASVRESDVAVRFGGDEFVVLLPRTSPAEARASAERVLTQFRVALMQEFPEASITSFSIGLASREQDHPAEAMELVNLADEALYLAKAGGKNRITVLRPFAAHMEDQT